jgi:hypothetical protein
LAKLYIEDFNLLVRDVNERSISHKLADYLQSEFNELELKVDCEYNGHGDNEKTLDADEKMIEVLEQKYDAQELKEKLRDTNAITVFPDIIVHKRGTDERNELVIEIKKSSNKDKWLRQFDAEKPTAFTKELWSKPYTSYHYNYGLFLDIPTNGEVANTLERWLRDCQERWKWFENGKKI